MSVKKEKPKVEVVGLDFLDKKGYKNMMTIVDFLKSKDVVIRYDYRNTWVVSFRRKRICYIKFIKGTWSLLFFGIYDHGYETFLPNEKMKEVIWANVCYCHCCDDCNPPGLITTIVGKEFQKVCRNCSLKFENGDGDCLKCIKQIILWRINRIAEKKVKDEEHIDIKKRGDLKSV
jgi:hypothetical protein